MKKNLLLSFLPSLLILMLMGLTAMGQQTTSAFLGSVKDKIGGVPGATVTAVHLPTGSRYVAATRDNGFYNLPNVQVGGPYRITVSAVGYAAVVHDNVTVNLGEEKRQDFFLSESSTELKSVVVNGTKSSKTEKYGSETFLSQKRINATPSVGRTLTDFIKYTPTAKVDNNGGISIAGQNNRFNTIYINGASANDQYGLSATGTNGGQAGVAPISIDAIEAFQINTSPYDVRFSGFTGGSINAITKSGSNDWKASFSYYTKNQNLTGKTPTDDKTATRTKLEKFSSNIYSVRIGGPIIKNKLFFNINGELQKENRPQPFVDKYLGNSTLDDINRLQDYLKTKYNYDAGGYNANPTSIDRKNVIAKLDWNVNDANKFSLSYSYTDAKRFSPSRSSKNTINFMNGGVLYPNKTNIATAELKSKISPSVNNNVLITYVNVNDNRNGIGAAFPTVSILDGSGRINFGTEAYSAANQLKQQTVNLIDELKYYNGKHTFSFILDGEYNKYYNLFMRNAYGSYTYASLSDFLNDKVPSQYQRSFSLLENDIIGDGSKAAANFKTYRIGAAIQDKVQLTDEFAITYGLRADYNAFPTTPFVDNYFNNTAVPVLSKYYDLKGAKSGQMPDERIVLSPRFGFNVKLNDDKTSQLRGGFGLFSGRLPAVWPGGVYSNSGVIIGEIFQNKNLPVGMTFRPDVNNQYDNAYFGGKNTVPSGEINLVEKNFKLPKVFKANLAVDFKLPGGINSSLEALYTYNINQIDYKSVNLAPPTGMTTGPGSRVTYPGTKVDLDPTTAGIQNPYSNIFLLQNGGGSGYSYNLTALLDKSFNFGLSLNASYTYGRSYSWNDGLSSQNSSQWRYVAAVNGRNDIGLAPSIFDLGHRVTAVVAYAADWFKFGRTYASLAYFGQSGERFSYTISKSMVNDYSGSETYDLMFVPNKASDLTFAPLTVAGKTYSAADQSAAFETYLSQNSYLNGRRGYFAQRNGSRTPFTNQLDLKLEQGFSIKTGEKKHTLSVSFEVQNFTNLLNKDWGRIYYVPYSYYTPLSFNGFVANTKTPMYQFNPAQVGSKPWSVSDGGYNSSRWTGMIGIKYTLD